MSATISVVTSAVLGLFLLPSTVSGQVSLPVESETALARTNSSALPDNPEPQTDTIKTPQQNQPSAASEAQAAPQNQQQKPENKEGAPSMGDLGFPTEQTKPNPEEQARLDKRSHMLKIHQRLGLITAVPLVATVVTGSMAGGKSTSSSSRDLHAALGSTTAGLYIATASYAIFAPKIKGTETRGPIRLHKALAWIHGPGMILTPVLGAMAFEQKSRGERIHGIASAHAPVAYVTAIAYGAAIASVSIKF